MSEVLKAQKELSAFLNRIRSLIDKASTDPYVKASDILTVIHNFEDCLTETVMKISMMSTTRSVSLFPIFEEEEKIVRGAIEELKQAVERNNMSQARRHCEILRSRLLSYLRMLSFMLKGVKFEEESAESILGIRVPEDLSPTASRVYAYLRRKIEADVSDMMHSLGMEKEELEEAIEELRKLGYVDVYMRGLSVVVRLKESS